jgi:hypothetical protein
MRVSGCLALVLLTTLSSLGMIFDNHQVLIHRHHRFLLQATESLHLPEACAFFYGGDKFKGPSNGRHLDFAANASRDGGCVPLLAQRGCQPEPVLITHTWIWSIDGPTPQLLLLLRAWMITQDLRRSRFYMWATAMTSIHPEWLEQFSPYVTLRMFDYDHETRGTPLSLSKHFSSWDVFNATTYASKAVQSDVIRNVILYNYGGLWLDNDAVPLRDLWPISAGLGLHFVPKFAGRHVNNHVMFSPCPRSPLLRRRLQALLLFPRNYPDAWPRDSNSKQRSWAWNDALSEHVRDWQALAYNVTQPMQFVDPSTLAKDAWNDLEFAFPMQWFDPLWVSGKPYNTSSFRRRMVCSGAYVWHRLTKHQYNSSGSTWGPQSGCDDLWDEILSDTADIRSLDARVLTGAETC